MSERLPTPAGAGYQPEGDLTWSVGRQGEFFVANLAQAVGEGSVEIKSEPRAVDRLFIEYECEWSDGRWHASGIRSTEAEVWAHLLGGEVLVAARTSEVRQMVERMVATGREADRVWGIVSKPKGPGDEFATRGIVVPILKFAPWLAAVSGSAS